MIRQEIHVLQFDVTKLGCFRVLEIRYPADDIIQSQLSHFAGQKKMAPTLLIRSLEVMGLDMIIPSPLSIPPPLSIVTAKPFLLSKTSVFFLGIAT